MIVVPGRLRNPRADARRDDARLAAPRPRRARSGRRRSAPARCCSPPPGSSTVSRRPRTGSRSRSCGEYGAVPVSTAGGRAGQGDHRGRRLVRHRHGADARRADRRRRRSPRRSSSGSSTTPSRRSRADRRPPRRAEIVELVRADAGSSPSSGLIDVDRQQPGRGRTAGRARGPRWPGPAEPVHEHVVDALAARPAESRRATAPSRLKSPPRITGRARAHAERGAGGPSRPGDRGGRVHVRHPDARHANRVQPPPLGHERQPLHAVLVDRHARGRGSRCSPRRWP